MDDLNENTGDNLPQEEQTQAIELPPPDTGQQQPDTPQEGGDEAKQADSPPFSLDLGHFGESMPPEEIQFLGRMAQESGATPEVASALMQRLGIYNQAVQDYMAKEWAEEARNDQEFGGAQFEQNIAVAKLALDWFATPELKELLAHSPIGNNPEVIRFLIKVGKVVSEDGVIASAGAPANNDVRNLFPNTQGLNP